MVHACKALLHCSVSWAETLSVWALTLPYWSEYSNHFLPRDWGSFPTHLGLSGSLCLECSICTAAFPLGRNPPLYWIYSLWTLKLITRYSWSVFSLRDWWRFFRSGTGQLLLGHRFAGQGQICVAAHHGAHSIEAPPPLLTTDYGFTCMCLECLSWWILPKQTVSRSFVQSFQTPANDSNCRPSNWHFTFWHNCRPWTVISDLIELCSTALFRLPTCESFDYGFEFMSLEIDLGAGQ